MREKEKNQRGRETEGKRKREEEKKRRGGRERRRRERQAEMTERRREACLVGHVAGVKLKSGSEHEISSCGFSAAI